MSKGLLMGIAAAAVLAAGGASAQSSLPMVLGIVKAIDADRLTIEHEAIPNLDAGEATGLFKAASVDLVKNIKAGGKIRFTAVRMNGQPTITSLLDEDAMLSGASCE